MKSTFVIILSMLLLCSCSKKQKAPPMAKGYLQTNGDLVKIGNIFVKTNSPLNTDKFKQFKWREDELWKVHNSRGSDAMDKFIQGAWALARDYPDQANGYQDIMAATLDYEYLGQPDKARSLANELINSNAPERFKIWAKGLLNRLDSMGKPVSLQFTAVDGQEVDLAKMKGKVVLVDFWDSEDMELSRVKAAYNKFHGQGFEVIGIYCYMDREQMDHIIAKDGLPWPQFFDGQDGNFTRNFGIDGSHMFLVDKNGCLRFDNVRAEPGVHTKGDTTSFVEKISGLLAEP